MRRGYIRPSWCHLRCVLVERYEGRLRDVDVLLAAGHHGDGGDVLDVTPEQMSDVCHHLPDIVWMSDAKPSLLSHCLYLTQLRAALLRIYK